QNLFVPLAPFCGIKCFVKRFVLLPVLLLSLLVCASLALGQMQPPAQSPIGFPDFSGFGLIDSFATLPAERTKLESLCQIRRASLDEASRTVEMALQRVDESADPPKAIRLHNASATVYLYKGDTTNAIAHFE